MIMKGGDLLIILLTDLPVIIHLIILRTEAGAGVDIGVGPVPLNTLLIDMEVITGIDRHPHIGIGGLEIEIDHHLLITLQGERTEEGLHRLYILHIEGGGDIILHLGHRPLPIHIVVGGDTDLLREPLFADTYLGQGPEVSLLIIDKK